MAETMAERSKRLAAGLFGGMKEAKARVSTPWLGPGSYWLRIDKIKLDQNRKNETALFVEFTVIKVLDDYEGHAQAHKRTGEVVTHAMWKKHESFLGNVKAFLATALDEDPQLVEEDHVFLVIEEDQPLTGTVLEVNNRIILTREKRQPFTEVNYVRTVPAEELVEGLDDSVKERFYPGDLLERMVAQEAA